MFGDCGFIDLFSNVTHSPGRDRLPPAASARSPLLQTPAVLYYSRPAPTQRLGGARGCGRRLGGQRPPEVPPAPGERLRAPPAGKTPSGELFPQTHPAPLLWWAGDDVLGNNVDIYIQCRCEGNSHRWRFVICFHDLIACIGICLIHFLLVCLLA